MMLEMTLVVAVREWTPKELVTKGVRARTTTSCVEAMK
jgi:hypothetical protein